MSNQETISTKIKRLQLDTLSAQKWAAEGKIETWVHRYLLSETGGSTNAPFSDSLKREQRWWNGPLKVNLSEVSPAVGTKPDMEYTVSEEYWEARTGEFAKTFTDLDSLPPLIVEYRSGELSLRDGNTRFGTMQRLGWPKCWIVIWYNSEADFVEHSAYISLTAGS